MTGSPEASFQPARQPKNPPLHRHLPKTLFQWCCREAAGEIPPGFLLFALTGPRSTAPNVVSPFSRSLGFSGGDRRRGRGQTAELAPGASVTAPALWPVIPRHPAPATDSPGWVCPVPPVEGERHTLQTLKPGGFNQWLATQNPQRNSGSEPSRRPFEKTRSAGSPITTSPFRGSTPTGASGRPLRASVSATCSPLPSSPTRHTRSFADRKAEAASAAGDDAAA